MTISIDDFKKVEIKIGHILSAEKVEETDKLLKLSVDFGEETPWQIVSVLLLISKTHRLLLVKSVLLLQILNPGL